MASIDSNYLINNKKDIIKQQVLNYLKYDNNINILNEQIKIARKERNHIEKNIEELINDESFKEKKIKYHNELILFNYETTKPGLTINLLKESLSEFFSTKCDWCNMTPVVITNNILEKINAKKEAISTQRKKSLRIKRVINKKI
jgi:hypothetical protein